ncbi:MAG TPA: CaiB/BaiF CoA-transferase family protein [Faecalibacter sp.]
MMNILNGIKILDFSRLLPGPMATKQLMQMGAEVIKIEHPNKPELTRLIPPFEDGISVSYLMVNKDKEVRQIQYETEEGRNEIYELVKEVDVLIETFRPGTMQTLGFDYETLKTINPKLIYVSCTSYGQSGPYAHLAGHDLNFMAYSGLLANNVNADGNITMPSYQVADLYGGTEQIINSVLLGIIQRTKIAKGDWFDVSITEAALPMNALLAPPVWYNEKAQAFDVLSGKLPHYTYYKCKDGKFVVLAGLEDKFWQNLCTKLGREEWKSENLMTLIHRQDIRQELIDLFLTKTRNEWVDYFQDTEVCFSPVLEFEETLTDPHFVAKKSYEYTEDRKHIIGFNLGIKQLD